MRVENKFKVELTMTQIRILQTVVNDAIDACIPEFEDVKDELKGVRRSLLSSSIFGEKTATHMQSYELAISEVLEVVKGSEWGGGKWTLKT